MDVSIDDRLGVFLTNVVVGGGIVLLVFFLAWWMTQIERPEKVNIDLTKVD